MPLYKNLGLCDQFLFSCNMVDAYSTIIICNMFRNCTFAKVFISGIFLDWVSSFHRVGLVFCGRQSPGGHNVVWGLYNALKIHNHNSVLLGFVGELHCLPHISVMHVVTAKYAIHHCNDVEAILIYDSFILLNWSHSHIAIKLHYQIWHVIILMYYTS